MGHIETGHLDRRQAFLNHHPAPDPVRKNDREKPYAGIKVEEHRVPIPGKKGGEFFKEEREDRVIILKKSLHGVKDLLSKDLRPQKILLPPPQGTAADPSP